MHRNGTANGGKGRGERSFWRVPLLAGMAILSGMALAPAVGNAFVSGFQASGVSLAARGGVGSFTPASVDPRLAAQVTGSAVSHARNFRFTPAGSETRPDRSVTVAVRVDRSASGMITVLAGPASGPADVALPGLRSAPGGFNLGVARGYESFAAGNGGSGVTGRALVRDLAKSELARSEMPELAGFSLKGAKADEAAGAPSRFATQIEMGQKVRTGRAPRTLEGLAHDYQVDVGGSFRVTRNVAVTAGLRYSSDRDRIRALTDSTRDNQAVYLGTQFRF